MGLRRVDSVLIYCRGELARVIYTLSGHWRCTGCGERHDWVVW